MVSRPRPRIAAVGMASWDRTLVLDHFPTMGTFATVRAEREGLGGTTANLAVASARLRAHVSLASAVGDDAAGVAVRAALAAEDGVDSRWLLSLIHI